VQQGVPAARFFTQEHGPSLQRSGVVDEGDVGSDSRCGDQLTVWRERNPMMPMAERLRKVIRRWPYPIEVMLACALVAPYSLSMHHIAEMMAECDVSVD